MRPFGATRATRCAVADLAKARPNTVGAFKSPPQGKLQPSELPAAAPERAPPPPPCPRMSKLVDPAFSSATRLPVADATSLDPTSYSDPEFLQAEQRWCFQAQWVCVGYADQVAKAGDCFTATVGGVGVVVTRDKKGALHAFRNVCRHRGHELVSKDGNYAVLSCPYHRWGYALDGRLMGTPLWRGDGGTTAEDVTNSGCLPERPSKESEDPNTVRQFSKADYGLFPVKARQWNCLIFVNVDGSAPPLEKFLGDMYGRWPHHRFGEWVVVRDRSYEVGSNWKLLVENYLEFYHLPSVHPELCAVSGVDEHIDTQESGRFMSYKTYPLSGPSSKARYAKHVGKGDGAAHGTPVDVGVVPHVSDLDGTEDANTAHHQVLFPHTALSLYPHLAFNILINPLSPTLTRERATLLMHPDSIKGPDAEEKIERIWAFFDLVNTQDITACEAVQRGVSNGGSAYRGGRFSPRYEGGTHRFQNMLLDAVTGNPYSVPGADAGVARVWGA